MIFELVREPFLRLLRTSAEPPETPTGTHASVEVFRASPAFLSYRLVGLSMGATLALLALVAGAVFGEGEARLIMAVVSVPLLLVLAMVYIGFRIDYEVRHYVVTDRSVRVREGAWSVREKTVTFANVQNLRVTQGPLQRFFGISDLRIDTAGGGGATAQGSAGGGHALTVAGIRNAAELRELVGGYVRRQSDAGLGDPDDRVRRGVWPGSELSEAALRDALVQVRDAARELRHAVEGA